MENIEISNIDSINNSEIPKKRKSSFHSEDTDQSESSGNKEDKKYETYNELIFDKDTSSNNIFGLELNNNSNFRKQFYSLILYYVSILFLYFVSFLSLLQLFYIKN